MARFEVALDTDRHLATRRGRVTAINRRFARVASCRFDTSRHELFHDFSRVEGVESTPHARDPRQDFSVIARAPAVEFSLWAT